LAKKYQPASNKNRNVRDSIRLPSLQTLSVALFSRGHSRQSVSAVVRKPPNEHLITISGQ
jgi:hypothetical protein